VEGQKRQNGVERAEKPEKGRNYLRDLAELAAK